MLKTRVGVHGKMLLLDVEKAFGFDFPSDTDALLHKLIQGGCNIF
jgi:hypothetical protein